MGEGICVLLSQFPEDHILSFFGGAPKNKHHFLGQDLTLKFLECHCVTLKYLGPVDIYTQLSPFQNVPRKPWGLGRYHRTAY